MLHTIGIDCIVKDFFAVFILRLGLRDELKLFNHDLEGSRDAAGTGTLAVT